MRTSLIVTTYEWPRALALVLRAVATQRTPPDETIVVDDGSGAATRETIETLAREFPTPLRHVWQEHRGFRAGAARNRGIAASRGDYVILLDGDMIPHRDFVADHKRAARPGAMLQGTRALLDATTTQALLDGAPMTFAALWRGADSARKVVRLPWLGRLRMRPRRDLRALIGGNQSFWRDDLVAVNGYDEAFVGWGWEDTDVVARCLHAGVERRLLKFSALTYHLDHTPRGTPKGPNPNRDLYERTLATRRVRADFGLDSHAREFVEPPADLRAERACA